MPHAYLYGEVDEHYLLEIEILRKVSRVLLIARKQQQENRPSKDHHYKQA